MTTFKAEVYSHQKRSDGTYNIKIRITHNRKKKYFSTNYYVNKSDLTKSFKIKNQYYIDETDKLILKFRKKLDKYGIATKSFTIEKIYEIITSADANLDLQTFFDSIKDGLGTKKHFFQTSINSLLTYMKRDSVDINEINTRLINGWISWIMESRKGNTAITYIANIRNLINRAKKIYNDEDMEELVIPRSPFAMVEKPKAEEPRKRAITVEELRKIAMLCYKKNDNTNKYNRFNLAKDLFLISFFFIGINIADLYELKKSNLKDGRITYNRRKTMNRRADKAEISLMIPDEVKPILEKYYNRGETDNLFVFKSHYSTKDMLVYTVNIGLKLIGEIIGIEQLQFYAARHTWATIAVNEAGVDKYAVHQALNHSVKEMAITDMYIKKDWSVIDRANRMVIDYCKLEINEKEE